MKDMAHLPHRRLLTRIRKPVMSPHLSRRRLIGITAAAAGLGLVPFGRPARADAHLVTWRGQAMGAVATLQVHHHDRAVAERLVERSLAEVRRLEAVFSLYREDSALVALNRNGGLVAPPTDLVTLLAECRRCWELTGGAFDPTVQALWALYQDHFSRPGADPEGPPAAAREAALERVGFGGVTFDGNRIVLPRRGMGLTLNGIAQGYVTDRVVDVLRAGGIESSLVDMGEPRAVGSRPSGEPWRVGIADPDDPERVADTLEAVDQAVATSGAYGFRLTRKAASTTCSIRAQGHRPTDTGASPSSCRRQRRRTRCRPRSACSRPRTSGRWSGGSARGRPACSRHRGRPSCSGPEPLAVPGTVTGTDPSPPIQRQEFRR